MDDTDEGEEQLSAREAARRLGVTERTVYAYVERGILAADVRRVGMSRRMTFTPRAVERCQAQLERNGE